MSVRGEGVGSGLAEYICKVMVSLGDMFLDTVREFRFGGADGSTSGELVDRSEVELIGLGSF